MGKGQLFLGTIRRKVGNIVGYKIANSNNAETQGVRVYQPNVANPQTTSQLDQRIKLAAANNFYRGLEGLLDHSWQGIKYGAVSRQYFMKIALQKNSQYQLPYVTKGQVQFVPGMMPISRGSISVNLPVGINNTEEWAEWDMGRFDESIDSVSDFENTTVASLTSYLIESGFSSNSGLMLGDQLTFVCVFVDTAGNFYPRYGEIVLSNTDTRALNVVLPFEGQFEALENSTGTERFTMRISSDINASLGVAGFGIIVSRYDERGKKWLRNNEVLHVSDTILARYMSANAYEAAIESYKKSAADVNSDWYLNQGDTNTGNSGSGFEPSVRNASLSVADTQTMVAYGQYGQGANNVGFIMKLARTNQYNLARVEGNVVTLYTGNSFNTGDIALGSNRRMLWDTARSRITNYTFVESAENFPLSQSGDEPGEGEVERP